MARNRTPSNVVALRGGYKKNPQRKRKGEPLPTAGIGAPPKHLTERQRAIWDEVVSICPPGVLGNSDRIALETLVRLIERDRHKRAEFKAAERTQMISLLSRFGMTPADRSRINVPRTPEKGNPFD